MQISLIVFTALVISWFVLYPLGLIKVLAVMYMNKKGMIE